MFIQTDRVPVTDDRGNTIWVRRKMDFGAAATIQATPMQDRIIATYVVNILGWDGPDFQGVACTEEAIRRLDPTDPLVDQVGRKIAELNPRPTSPNPPSPSTAGSMSGGEGDLIQTVEDVANTSSPT